MLRDETGAPVDYVYLAINDAFLEALGRSREEMLGRRASELFPGADWQRIVDSYLSVAVSGEPLESEIDSPILGYFVQVTTFVPAPGYIAFTVRDISARKQTEAELQRSEARFRTLYETMDQGIIYLDAEGRALAMNPAARRMMGVSLEELHPPTQEQVRQYAIAEDGRPFPEEERPGVRALTRGEPAEGLVGVYNPQLEEYRWLQVRAVPQFRPGESEPYQAYVIFDDVTEARAATARLRFQAQLLDSVEEAVMATDLEGKVIYWGRASAGTYGVGREEALGQPVEALVGLTAEEATAMRGAIQAEGRWRGEVDLSGKQGGPRRISLNLSPVRDEDGEPVGFIGVGRDISRRYRREQELEALVQVAEALHGVRHTRDLFAKALEQVGKLFQGAGSAFGLLDENGGLAITNVVSDWSLPDRWNLPGGEGISGRVLASGKPFVTDNLLGEETYGPLPAAIGEGVAAACVPLAARDEVLGVLWVAREKSFSHGDVRRLTAVAGMVAGALDRLLLVERVEAQAEQLQRVMDTVDDGLLLLDGEGRILLANAAARRHLALLAPERAGTIRLQALGGRPLSDLLAPAPAGHTAHDVEAAGPPARTFEVVAHSLGGEEGGAGWVTVVRDVTEDRRLEKQARQQDRLAATGQIAAGVAHDFNNLLSAIVLNSQLLARSARLTESERRRVEGIQEQAEEGAALVRQILDFGQRSILRQEPLDLAPLVTEVVSTLRRMLPDRIELVWEEPAERYLLEGDASRLKQALMNLAFNARDAMAGGGRLHLELGPLDLAPDDDPPRPEMAPGPWARLHVRDEGEGIAPEILPRIFDPFFTTRSPAEASGLGLSQVHGIVHQHDGRIVVESAGGDGTTVTIYLPLTRAPVAGARKRAEAGPRETILLVEDEEIVRGALQAVLETLGYKVLPAADGREALARFREEGEQVDLVLSALIMEEMGALELHERLCALDPHLKMMVITGYPLADQGKGLLEQGIVGWLQKPVTLEALETRLSAVLA